MKAWRQACVLVLLLGGAVLARADYTAGRLATLSGTVYVQTPGDADSHLAAANEVLAEGDQVATWDGAGAELQFAGADLQLAPDTVIALTRVDSGQLVAFISQGAVAAARLPDRGAPLLTLQGTHLEASLVTAGRMRLSVWPSSQQEWLSVRQGRVAAEADQNALTLYAGQGLQAFYTSAGLATSVTAAQSEDALDYALLQSAQQLRGAASVARLGGDWIGAGALDGQGDWLEVSSVGPLWVPMFLPAGWAPYRSGHWRWNAVWGWTWIDDLPWCWMPYHYGSWIWWNNRWAWSPRGRRPVFSPAAPPPPGVALPPLPAPWHPGGRVALASRAASVARALPSAPADPVAIGAASGQSAPTGRIGAPAPPPRSQAPSVPAPAALAAVPATLPGRSSGMPAVNLPTTGTAWPPRAAGVRGPDLRDAARRLPEPHVRPPRLEEVRAQPAPAAAMAPPAPPAPPPAQAWAGGQPPANFVPHSERARGPMAEAREAPPPAPVSAAPRPVAAPPGSRPNASGGASRRPERGS